MAKSKKYRLRNAKGSVKEYTTEEILTRIKKGKISEEDEISADELDQWRKISSVPQFFDALMARLHKLEKTKAKEVSKGASSQPQDSEKTEKPKPLTISENETRRKSVAQDDEKSQVHAESKEPKESVDKTHHIEASPDDIDPQALDELFSESGVASKSASIKVEKTDPHKAPSTAIVPSWREKPIEQERTTPLAVQTEKLDIQESLHEEEAPAVFAKKRAQARRRKLIIVAGVTIVLSLLLQPSEEESEPEKKEAAQVVEQAASPNVELTKERTENLILEGDILYARHTSIDYRQALVFYEEALGNKKVGAKALGKAAETGARLYRFLKGEERKKLAAKIIKFIQTGRITDPQSSYFYRAEALLALYSGNLERAKTLLDSAVESDPSNPANALALGELGIAVNDPGSAREALSHASQSRATKVLATYLNAKLQFDQRRYVEAKEMALRALEFNPFFLEAGYLSGRVSETQGRDEEAIKIYSNVSRFALLGSKKTAEEIFSRLASLHSKSGNKEGAMRAYSFAKHFSVNPDQYKSAAPFSEEAFKEAVYQKKYFVEQANSYLYQKKFEDAVNYLQVASLLDPNDGAVLFKFGETLEEEASHFEDLRRVATYYERAIQKDRSLYRAYVKLGLLETDQYNLDRALRLLQQAESLAPNRAEPYIALGKHFYKRRDFTRAVEHFTRARKLKPDDSEIHYYVGLLLVKAKKGVSEQASALFEKSYRLDPFNYDALVEWLKLKTANYQKSFAIKFVRNLLQKEPRNPKLYWVMGEVYASNKEYRRAIQLYHQSLDLDKKSSKVRMSLGFALESIGQMDRAVPEYRTASMLDRSNLEGFYRSAQLLYEAKNADEAERVLKDLLQRSPKYPGGHRLWAKIHRARNKPDRVIASMEKEVGNNPANLKFRLELAQTYLDYNKNQEAIEQLREIGVLAVGKSPSVIYTKIRAYILLSESYRKMGDFESAEGAIGLAVRIDSDLPEVQRELGFVFEGLHRDREAVQAFQHYLKREPTAQDAPKIKQLIRKLEIPK